MSVYGIYGRGRITVPGRFPYSFREAILVKVPRIGEVNVERLGQRRRVAQTETNPFSLTTPGSDH